MKTFISPFTPNTNNLAQQLDRSDFHSEIIHLQPISIALNFQSPTNPETNWKHYEFYCFQFWRNQKGTAASCPWKATKENKEENSKQPGSLWREFGRTWRHTAASHVTSCANRKIWAVTGWLSEQQMWLVRLNVIDKNWWSVPPDTSPAEHVSKKC